MACTHSTLHWEGHSKWGVWVLASSGIVHRLHLVCLAARGIPSGGCACSIPDLDPSMRYEAPVVAYACSAYARCPPPAVYGFLWRTSDNGIVKRAMDHSSSRAPVRRSRAWVSGAPERRKHGSGWVLSDSAP